LSGRARPLAKFPVCNYGIRMAKVYDIAVLGATPAGLAAAGALAGAGRSVVVLGAPASSAASPLCDWVGRDFLKLHGLTKTMLKPFGAAKFSRVCYYNSDLSKQAVYNTRGTAGAFVAVSDLLKAFRAAAEKAGAKIRTTRTRPAIRLDEDMVHLTGTSHIRARLLLAACGQPGDIMSSLSLPMRTAPHGRLTVAGLNVPLPKKGWPRKLNAEMHVVELPHRNELGMFFVCGKALHLRVISRSAALGTRAAEMSALVTLLQQEGVFPADLPLGRSRGAVWHPPGGVALDMETHVAKRCLLIGTAGGFAAGFTGQTLTPTVKSALLGAQVAEAALNSPDTQTVLMRFKTSWRSKLADYLRPPSTSLQMLLPLLFANKNIVSRFTRAMLYGESI